MAVTISGTTGVGVSTTPSYPVDVSVGSLGTTVNSQLIGARLLGLTGNNDILEVSNVRGTAGTDWTTAGWRIQQRVDASWMGYIQFNGTPTGINSGGISFGTGQTTTNANSIVERVRIDSSGNVTPGATTTQNLGSSSLLWSNTYSNKFISPNTVATSLTDGAVIFSGTSGAILLDDSSQKRISWNDGAGNLNIRSGNYYNGTALVYTKGSADANGGASTITLSSDGAVDGAITMSVAAIGVPAATVTYTNSLSLTTTQVSTDKDLYFNSGYGSAGLAFGCRAWVNFNGVTNGTFAGGTSTVTRVAGSTTATVTTTTNHNLHTGETVYVNFVISGVAAGLYVVTVLSNTTFTITTAATTALTNFSITFSVSLIRGAGNVSSVADGGVGIYIVNFSTPMPDTNYAAVFGFGIGSNPGADANNDAFAHIGEQTIYSQYVYVESAADTSYDRAYMSVVIIR